MSATIQQSFLLDENISKQLEELAEDANLSTTDMLQEIIKERYDDTRKK
ncbi:MAG: hypothetical protein QM493_01090 [Sulfurovum sp.]